MLVSNFYCCVVYVFSSVSICFIYYRTLFWCIYILILITSSQIDTYSIIKCPFLSSVAVCFSRVYFVWHWYIFSSSLLVIFCIVYIFTFTFNSILYLCIYETIFYKIFQIKRKENKSKYHCLKFFHIPSTFICIGKRGFINIYS